MKKKRPRSLKDIELQYDTQSILMSGDFVWPIIRFKINEELRKKDGLASRSVRLGGRDIIKLLKTFSYGISNLFVISKFDYWIFSSSDRRKKSNSKFYEDRVAEPLAIGLKDSLVIENPYPLGMHYPKALLNRCNVISQTPFYALTKLISFFIGGPLEIENENIVEKILHKNDITINYKKLLKNYIAQYRLIKFLLIFGKPKAVFFVYSASSMGYIKALKEKKVPIIELQHGVINEMHYAYNVFKDFGTKVFPDYLFTYGENEKYLFDENNFFIEHQCVFSAGYFFLEKFTKYYAPSAIDISDNTYSKTVVFSLQDPFEEYLTLFLNELAQIDDTIMYIVVPRNTDKPYGGIIERKNLMIERERSIYECLRAADFHATINSTTAIESLCFGVPNILFNYNGWAKEYYKKLLNDKGHTIYVDSPSEFVGSLYFHIFYDKEKIIEKSNFFFKHGFEGNIKSILQEKILCPR